MRKVIFYMLLLLTVNSICFAQVGVGTNTPDTSAEMEISSTSKGFLLPRMTETQMNAIQSPAQGLMVYCTDCSPKGVYFRNTNTFLYVVTALPSGVGSTDVYNSSTGKIWMDRNLGASQVATASNDALAFGDLYQWGRTSDGHEDRNSPTVNGPVTLGTEGPVFLKTTSSPYDWYIPPQDDTRWNSGTEGSPVKTVNDPCPDGYRIPTETEFNNERLSWPSNGANGAFASPLKLTTGARRAFDSGGINGNSTGYYWTSTVNGTDARNLRFSGLSTGLIETSRRANGYSVRCIKE